MKISKLFHWLYASVMFLPLLIIPIFAIWTINHDNNQAISIDVSCNKVVDFNQLVKNGNFVDNSNWLTSGNLTLNFNDNSLSMLVSSSNSYVYQEIELIENHTYLFKVDCELTTLTTSVRLNVYNPNVSGFDATSVYTSGTFLNQVLEVEKVSAYSSTYVLRLIDSRTNDFDTIVWRNCQCFDLTQMFGLGNEPSLQVFNQWYSDDYYDYTISRTELLKDYEIVTYNNTDVGSQFIYTLYRSCDEYLNFDDVLSLGSISDWIETNVFNGNAPLVYTIVWHYLDYWLILSIFWLCFDVLIYVPQIAHRWLDKASLE